MASAASFGRSRLYETPVGHTIAARDLPLADLLIDRERYASEGDWAFCRLTSESIPAVRLGFQLGSFDIGPSAQPYDPALLQLHLEVMTADGGLLWVPTGRFDGGALQTSADEKAVSLRVGDVEVVAIRGWPAMTWHVRSDDGELEAELSIDVGSVTVLPDAVLPSSTFAMWETLARVRGRVRIGSSVEDVEGHAFYDHTRVERVPHDVPERRRYLYTTLALDDGGGLFGYHAEDPSGQPIEDYCFGVHVDADGRGTFLPEAVTTDIRHDADGLPAEWSLDWRGEDLTVAARVAVRPLPIVRGWGGPMADRMTSRAGWSVMPLVLDASVRVHRGGDGTDGTLAGHGLAESFDADAWFAEG